MPPGEAARRLNGALPWRRPTQRGAVDDGTLGGSGTVSRSGLAPLDNAHGSALVDLESNTGSSCLAPMLTYISRLGP